MRRGREAQEAAAHHRDLGAWVTLERRERGHPGRHRLPEAFTGARGLAPRLIHLSLALRNTPIPVIIVSGIQLGFLFAFAVVAEAVFQWPGIGLLFLQALGVSHWPHFARLVRGAALAERNKDHIAAARLAGRGSFTIMRRHLLPNVLNPIAVLATLDIAFAVMGEVTLSFQGFGLPPAEPSLGTLIRSGYDYLFSGEWWLAIFPALALMALVVNLFGDWLRDALNPQLR